jgi:hypothetical protein
MAKKPSKKPAVPYVLFHGDADPTTLVALATKLLAAGFGVQISAVALPTAPRRRRTWSPAVAR